MSFEQELQDLIGKTDAIIHTKVGDLKTLAQSAVSAMDDSNATVAGMLNDVIGVLNAINVVAPRVFTLYPEIGLLANTLQQAKANGTIDMTVIYRTLFDFLNPTPATPAVTEEPTITPEIVSNSEQLVN